MRLFGWALILLGVLGLPAYAVAPQDVDIVTTDSAHARVAGTRGSAPASRGVIRMGGFDGTNDQDVSVDTSGRIRVLLHDGSSNSISSTSNALDINIKSQTNAVKVSKSTADNAVNNALFVQPSDGTNAAAGAVGSAVPAGAVMSGGTDGTNTRQMAVSTTGHPKTDTFDGSGNAITSTVAPTGVRGLDVAIQTFVAPVADHILVGTTLNTTTTNANQVIATYTVPAGKSFALISWSLANTSGNAVDANPARLRVAGTDIAVYATTANPRVWLPPALGCPGVNIASSGQVVTLTITPSAATSTNWWGMLVGYLRTN